MSAAFPIILASDSGFYTFRYPRPGLAQNVVRPATRAWTFRHKHSWLPHMCCMGDHGSRVSVAFSVWCLIKDYHSPMDCWPRWEPWTAVF